ncbi:MAG: PF20097 family protein [Intestinimonas sp.]|jgi:uncharacterized protein (UPF0212 family)|nr:PF20097 family protein [Intestinimonas sp.]
MKCPFCGEEMESGMIITMRDIGFAWIPEGKKLPLVPLVGLKKMGGMLLGESTGFTRAKLDFNICKKCNKGISSL